MYVVEVIPLRRGVAIESLSYFSSSEYVLGTFLEVPVRGKKLFAVVTDCKPVSTTKTALKAATFSLRKLPPQEHISTLPQTILDTAVQLGSIMPARIGAILYALLPPDVRNGSVQYPHSTPHYGDEDSTPQILQATTEERLVAYRSHIRSTFAHRGSVLMVLPTTADVEYYEEQLKSGIEDRVIVFSSAQTKSKRRQAYEAFQNVSAAKLIITTPSFAYIDRTDITSIIIERAGSGHYRQRTRPYLDHREVFKEYAKITGRSLILGDTLVLSEDEARRRTDEYQTFGENPKRLSIKSKLDIVEQKEKPTPEEPFQLFSSKLQKSIENTIDGRGKVFLYAARRGLAPLVTCFDCGHIFRCPDSGAPFSLMRTYEQGEEKRWFLCATSGKREPAADVCPNCGSWRLRERGVGIQQVADAFRNTFPDYTLFVLDQETAKTHKKAKTIIDDFYRTKGGVLLGTVMGMSYLHKPVDLSAIISVDAVRAIPTWRTDEHFFSLLLRLREISDKQVIVQTRSTPDDLLLYAGRGAVERFYDDELKLREMLGYPPHCLFILLSWQGSKLVVDETESDMKARFSDYKISTYSNPGSNEQKMIRYGLLRIERKDWPEKVLLEKLQSLPPNIRVEINPERIV